MRDAPICNRSLFISEGLDSENRFRQHWGEYEEAKAHKNERKAYVEVVACRAHLQEVAGDGYTPEKESEIMQRLLVGIFTKQKVVEMYNELFECAKNFPTRNAPQAE